MANFLCGWVLFLLPKISQGYWSAKQLHGGYILWQFNCWDCILRRISKARFFCEITKVISYKQVFFLCFLMFLSKKENYLMTNYLVYKIPKYVQDLWGSRIAVLARLRISAQFSFLSSFFKCTSPTHQDQSYIPSTINRLNTKLVFWALAYLDFLFV